jgi:uncharacterized protein
MSNSLKINVVTIPEEGLNFVFSADGKWFKECLQDGDQPPDFNLRKVDVQCQITRVSSTIFIKGNLSVLLGICCSRCLEEADLPADGDFYYTLAPIRPEDKEDVELQAEELEISYYQGDFIDLAPIVCEQVILQIPIKPLCSEECKGLCPHCGVNLNAASCNCDLEFVDPRLAALKNIKIKNN